MNIGNVCINNIPETDIKFLIILYNQSFPRRPYDCDIPYKKVRYMLTKYVDKGILELNNYGYRCEITCNFTSMGLDVINAIRATYGCGGFCAKEFSCENCYFYHTISKEK